mmetsp:Transcript_47541/g.93790  ORF Transcript_47541/g.93790 Transcript_47541/m.93790 type:complete len:225 (+) Transcript_47541:1627-2301(+)
MICFFYLLTHFLIGFIVLPAPPTCRSLTLKFDVGKEAVLNWFVLWWRGGVKAVSASFLEKGHKVRNLPRSPVGDGLALLPGRIEEQRGVRRNFHLLDFVSRGVHLRDLQRLDSRQLASQLLVCWFQFSAMAAPRGIELHQNIISRVHDLLLEGVPDENADRPVVVRFVRHWLTPEEEGELSYLKVPNERLDARGCDLGGLQFVFQRCVIVPMSHGIDCHQADNR